MTFNTFLISVSFETPITLQVDFKHHLPAEMLDYLPIVKRTSAYTIEYKAADMQGNASWIDLPVIRNE